jgi:hypothetical protein
MIKGIHRLTALQGKLLHTTISGGEEINRNEISAILTIILQQISQPLCESLLIIIC